MNRSLADLLREKRIGSHRIYHRILPNRHPDDYDWFDPEKDYRKDRHRTPSDESVQSLKAKEKRLRAYQRGMSSSRVPSSSSTDPAPPPMNREPILPIADPIHEDEEYY